MRIRPLVVFYLIVALLFVFDFIMWQRHQKVVLYSSLIKNNSTQLANIYSHNTINPLTRRLRVRVNTAHEQLIILAKSWPIHNHKLNLIILKIVFWVLVPVLMLLLLWLHFKTTMPNKE